MARTHSSYTASPTRTRSPERSPALRSSSSSEDGSQYEMDLDALGLNSTFESTALEGSFEPQIDRVDSTEVEGPEDFTMNMTYWMTADLLPAQVKSRNEARRRGSLGVSSSRQASGYGDEQDADPEPSTAASPTVHADVNGTTVSRENSTPASERSMAHDEKVRSFLSALPDAHAHTGTDTTLELEREREREHEPGLSAARPRQSKGMLHVLRASPNKARSLQPTVEDGDTPRKSTQQTVVHHPAPLPQAHDDAQPPDNRIADLQARLDQQELASRSRLTELETILSYTRSELETTRNDNYRLHTQHDAFERQLQQLEQANREARDEAAAKSQQLDSVQAQLTQLQDKLALAQTRADALQADLGQATAEAKAAREDAKARHAADAASTKDTARHLSRIASLEATLRDTQFSLECAQTDVAAKAQLLQTNIELNASIRALRSELEAQQAALTNLTSRKHDTSSAHDQLQSELNTREQSIAQHAAERDSLERQLNTAQGRITGLEANLATLRTQLTEAHRTSGSAHTEAERLSQDLSDLQDRLAEAQIDADRRVADVEAKLTKAKDLKTSVESELRDFKSAQHDLVEGHEAMLADVRDKAEDAVRKAGALLTQERKEKTRLKKEVARLQTENETLRTRNDDSTKLDLGSSDEEERRSARSDSTTTPLSPPPPPPPSQPPSSTKDKEELASLRAIIASQHTTLKTLKRTHATTLSAERASHERTLAALQSRLESQAADHAAINAALDEQLSTLLSKLMKERARTVVGKRDGQWEEAAKGVVGEKRLLGKALMREWGRGEFGGTEVEGKGGRRDGDQNREGGGGGERGQVYGYKYVKRV
ncbi:hypothetical protein E8E13_007521 [Curvularia kusanoi]|uniref:Uncharacterized protein n=1 Tax=Curvularia kusanoi TaxID=90978 RepID=A0A9P4TMD3_CURKU|nr:hypothetical protein E8E13_007521 [Curvularia kusanoi]